MQPAIYQVSQSTERLIYGVADQTIVVDAQDHWAAKVIRELFSGWYLTPESRTRELMPSPAIIISSSAKPPEIPRSCPQFEIAGAGICFTEGETSYIDIEGSIIAIGQPGNMAVEVWTNGRLESQSPVLTRVVTYALAAALRRRRLFELHSGAVTNGESGQGVLIIGPSGSGKSTLTVQLATAGWHFLTDDVLLLSEEGGSVRAWPLRRCFAITSDTLAASNFLRGSASLNQLGAEGAEQIKEKKQFLPHRVFDSEFREQCLPRALFFSQISGEERSQVSRLSSAESMARLIRMSPWSCYDRTTAAEHLAALSALVKQSTGYSLLAGKDLLDPACAKELISSYTRA